MTSACEHQTTYQYNKLESILNHYWYRDSYLCTVIPEAKTTCFGVPFSLFIPLNYHHLPTTTTGLTVHELCLWNLFLFSNSSKWLNSIDWSFSDWERVIASTTPRYVGTLSSVASTSNDFRKWRHHPWECFQLFQKDLIRVGNDVQMQNPVLIGYHSW